MYVHTSIPQYPCWLALYYFIFHIMSSSFGMSSVCSIEIEYTYSVCVYTHIYIYIHVQYCNAHYINIPCPMISPNSRTFLWFHAFCFSTVVVLSKGFVLYVKMPEPTTPLTISDPRGDSNPKERILIQHVYSTRVFRSKHLGIFVGTIFLRRF